MQAQEEKIFEAYTTPSIPAASAPTTVADTPIPPVSREENRAEQEISPTLEQFPPHMSQHPRPHKTIRGVIITLLLAIILGAGLFTVGQFMGSNSTVQNSQTTTTSTTPSSGSTAQTQQEAAIASVEPAVVELTVTTSQGEQIGSGVILDTKGDIVTNAHVVSGEQNIEVALSNGATEQGQLIGSDVAADLAVVRITPFAHMTVAQLGNSSTLVVGQDVLAIGNPLGITETATHGIVSALNRSVTESTGATLSNTIQTDAALNPGNSGGALITLQGQVVGIPTVTAVNTESNTEASGLSFAIPSNTVKTVVQQLLQQAGQ